MAPDHLNTANGRVTLALIGQKLEQIHGSVKEMQDVIGPISKHVAVCQDRWEHHDKEHDNLKKKGNLADIGSYVAALVSGVAGFLGGN